MAQQKDKWKEGQKERSLTGKKGIFIKQQKGHVLKLSLVSVHQHAGTFWKKEIPGEAMLAPLSSPAFVD